MGLSTRDGGYGADAVKSTLAELLAVLAVAYGGCLADVAVGTPRTGGEAHAAVDGRGGEARSALVDKRTRCEKPAIVAGPPRLVPPRFPLIDASRPNPICRLAQRRTIDVPLGSVSGRTGFDPRPACGNYDAIKRCFPSAFRNGNARVLRRSFAPPVVAGDRLIAVRDSFGAVGDSPRSSPPFAYIEQGPYAGCFNLYDAARRLRGSTDPRTSRLPCDPANAGRSLATIEFQGRGCMVTRNVERRYVIAGLVQTAGQDAALNTGLRGFVPLTAVPVAPGVDRRKGVAPRGTAAVAGGLNGAELRALQDAYPGCGRKGQPRMTPLPADQLQPADGDLHAADNVALQPDGSQAWPSPSFPFADQYLNATTLAGGCRTQSQAAPVAGCTGFYANYQGPCYAPDVAAVALSTTYVSGANTSRSDNPGNVRAGGIARAYVRRDRGPGSFVAFDRMLYADNNAPDAQGPVVIWAFGNFNPNAAGTNAASRAVGDNKEQGIWGWTPIRRPRAAVGTYTC